MTCKVDEFRIRSKEDVIAIRNYLDYVGGKEIKIISTVFPPHMVAEQLVQSAITNSAKRPAGADNLHNGIVSAGKDNATAAMFSRR